MRAREYAEQLLVRLRIELKVPRGERASQTSDSDLEFALAEITAWLTDGHQMHLRSVARAVVDRWSLTSALGADAIALSRIASS